MLRGGAIEWNSLSSNYSTPRYETEPIYRKSAVVPSISKSRRFNRPHRTLLSHKLPPPASGSPENHSALQSAKTPSAEDISSPIPPIVAEAVQRTATVAALTERVDAVKAGTEQQAAARPASAPPGSRILETSLFNSTRRMGFLKDLLFNQKQNNKRKTGKHPTIPDANAILKAVTQSKRVNPTTPSPRTMAGAPTTSVTGMDASTVEMLFDGMITVLTAVHGCEPTKRKGAPPPVTPPPAEKKTECATGKSRTSVTGTSTVPATVKDVPVVYVHRETPSTVTVTHIIEHQKTPSSVSNWWYNPSPSDGDRKETKTTASGTASSDAHNTGAAGEEEGPVTLLLQRLFGDPQSPNHQSNQDKPPAASDNTTVEARSDSITNSSRTNGSTVEMQAEKQQEEALRTTLLSRDETIRELTDRLKQVEGLYQDSLRAQRSAIIETATMSHESPNQEVSVTPSNDIESDFSAVVGSVLEALTESADSSPVEVVVEQVQLQVLPVPVPEPITLWDAMDAMADAIIEAEANVSEELGSQESAHAVLNLTAPGATVADETPRNVTKSADVVVAGANLASDNTVIQDLERAIAEYQWREQELVQQCSALSAQLCLLRGQKYMDVDRSAIAARKNESAGVERRSWFKGCVYRLFGVKL